MRRTTRFFYGRTVGAGVCLAIAAACTASASVRLPLGGATAGSEHDAAFQIERPCGTARFTTSLTVRIPPGFEVLGAEAPKGWRVDILRIGRGKVRWTAVAPEAVLVGNERGEFVLRGRVMRTPGTLYFHALQGCDIGSIEWSEVPGNVAGEKLVRPAPRLDVLPAGVAPVDIRDGWVRPTVPGQHTTAAYMKLSAPMGSRLVGIDSPVAGETGIYIVRIEGDTLQRRPVEGGFPLPARRSIELRPGSYHVMLFDLKKPLPAGSSVPMTFHFVDAKGTSTSAQVVLPVGMPAPKPAPRRSS
ncbi:conserved exported hypothetical protein [Burkholderiales bacterium 8X]|nr:conserved exported hypothetical protein [Burkholderiales bacterium 8X]